MHPDKTITYVNAFRSEQRRRIQTDTPTHTDRQTEMTLVMVDNSHSAKVKIQFP